MAKQKKTKPIKPQTKTDNSKHTKVKTQKPKKAPKQTKTNKFNVAIAVIGAFIIALSTILIGWFVYIKLWAPEKIISTTHIVDMQTTTDGSMEPFIEVKYNSNKNNNGYECLDIKYNFLIDENKSSLYSQGIQYAATSTAQSNSLSFNYYADYSTRDKNEYKTTNNFGSTSYYRHCFGSFTTPNFTKNNYQSIDNYKTTSKSTNVLDIYSSFKLELGNEIFMVKFRGLNDYTSNTVNEEKKNEFLNKTYMGEKQYDAESYLFYLTFFYDTYHHIYDVNFLNKTIFESLSTLKNGTHTVVYDFPDMFDYYKYDKDSKQYSATREIDTVKISQQIKNYYSIKVTISDDGVQQSTDSLFNCFNGQSTFNITGNYENTEYFIGRAIIYTTLNDFDLIKLDNGTYNIKLKEEFITEYEQSKNLLYLNLTLDYYPYEQQGMVVNEPTLESLCGFNVYKLEINKNFYGG